jgi:hypothetical protein
MELVIACLVGIAASLAAIEFGAWAPWLSNRILDLVVRRLPKEPQDRYREEWTALLESLPSPLSRIVNALSPAASIHQIAFFCKIDRTFRFAVGDHGFYLSLEQGIVAFHGTNATILKSRNEFQDYMSSARIGQWTATEIDGFTGMVWATLEVSRRDGPEACLKLIMEFIEQQGWMDRNNEHP